MANDHFRQRKHARALSAIRVRVLRLQLLRNQRHLRQSILYCDTVFQASNSVEIVAATSLGAGINGMQRRPEFSLSARCKLKVFRQHSNDRHWHSAQRNCLADHIVSSGKALLPGAISQDHGVRSVRQVLARIEISTEYWRNAQSAKESIAHAST